MKWFKRKQVEPYDTQSSVPPTPEQVNLVLEKARKHTDLAKSASEGSKTRIINAQLASSYLAEAKILNQLMGVDTV